MKKNEIQYSIIADNVSKSYKMYKNQKERIKDLLWFRDYGEDFYAIKNLSFKVNQGEVVGLIGLNGSGKSTLANMLTGVSIPSEGNMIINGIPAMIAVSSGLNNSLTGMENIELKGLMIGLTLKQIEQLKPSIIEFADIGQFIYQPVKTYSTGMKARLGFAISVNVDPDILIIDEALSVGDSTFSQKCLNKINEYKEKGKTIFFVSHSLSQIKDFCDKILWLEYGMMKAYGVTSEVLPMYERFVSSFNKMSNEEKKEYRNTIIENHNHLLLKQEGH